MDNSSGGDSRAKYSAGADSLEEDHGKHILRFYFGHRLCSSVDCLDLTHVTRLLGAGHFLNSGSPPAHFPKSHT